MPHGLCDEIPALPPRGIVCAEKGKDPDLACLLGNLSRVRSEDILAEGRHPIMSRDQRYTRRSSSRRIVKPYYATTGPCMANRSSQKS